MTTTVNPGSGLAERPARALVAGVRVLARFRLALSALGLLVVFLLGAGYLLLDSLQITPLASHYSVRVELAQSGSLLPNQDVTLRGVRIGRVTSVDVAGGKVVAVASIDGGVRIPAAGRVRVAALSAAGEQHLDFLPAGDSGPYLSDGAFVPSERTSSPMTMSAVLNDLNGPLAQIDPARLAGIERELGVTATGPQKLAEIIDGGMFMISTLDSVLPQTVSLLHNSKMVLTTLGQVSPGIQATSANLARTLAGMDARTAGFESLMNRIPGTLTTVDNLIADNSPTMVQLLGNLVTVSQMSYVHIPALQEFFYPKQRTGSTLDAITSAFHDGSVWAYASIYPRYTCDYNVPRMPGIVPDFPEPYLNSTCTDNDPALVRGAQNAPRPPGDNTAYPGSNGNPLATADAPPTGPLSIPTPYGGPHA
jgi:virulence factor Mce-like protein